MKLLLLRNQLRWNCEINLARPLMQILEKVLW